MFVYNPKSAAYSLESYEPSEIVPEEINQNNHHFIKNNFLNRGQSRNQIPKFNTQDLLYKNFNFCRPLSDDNLCNKYIPNIGQYNNFINNVPTPVLKPSEIYNINNSLFYKPLMSQNINYVQNINPASINYLNIQPQLSKCKSSKILDIFKQPQSNLISSNKIILPMKFRQLPTRIVIKSK